jgi:hypothetical protein
VLKRRSKDRSIPFVADEEVRAAIGRIGRTEDVQFSPDGARLAVVGHLSDRLLILDVEIHPAGLDRIRLTAFSEIESPSFDRPHGIAWIDNETVMIANRDGILSLIALPADGRGTTTECDAVRVFGADGQDLIRTPGSVEVHSIGDGVIEMFVCNNYVHHVSRHLIDARNGYEVIASDLMVEEVTVPDGIARSPSGRWIAISNHEHQHVMMVRDEGHGRARQTGTLTGILYPHGLTFTQDEKHILVADAGAPNVVLFSSPDGDWNGERQPSDVIRIMDQAMFRRGHRNPTEGGPKGIDLSRDNRIMVTTCREQPLAFFDMDGLIAAANQDATQGDAAPGPDTRDVLIGYLTSIRAGKLRESKAMRRVHMFDGKRLAEHQRRLNAVLASRSWRITAPMRWIGTQVKRLKR